MAVLQFQNPGTPTAELDSVQVGTDGGLEVRREIVVIGDPTTSANQQGVTADRGALVELNVATTQSTSLASISFAGSGDNTVVAGVALKTVRIFKMFFTVASATTITFKDTTPTSFTGAMTLNAGGSFTLDFDTEPWFLTATAKGFVITSSNAVQVSGAVWYTQS